MRKAARAHLARARTSASPTDLSPPESAKIAGLRYVDEGATPGITRRGSKSRPAYVRPDGTRVADPADLQRIRGLAIPPAWTDVWICPYADGHLQATGRDVRGRKQYRYHERWREVRDEVKYGRLIAFADALPRIRRKTAADLRRSGLPREKVLAAVVQLLEKTLIRVGNDEYARQNGSVGLTTMRDGHARVHGGTVRFEFRGKSGVEHAVELDDRRLARIVKACRDLPGQELFQYVDVGGQRQAVGSGDVNDYLRRISGQDFTAKDFRTWAGTVLAAQALAAGEPHVTPAQAKRHIAQAIGAVAARLGNTKTVCRACYVHPAILEAYVDGTTIDTIAVRPILAGTAHLGALAAAERAVVGILAARLKKSA
ncbi:MAG: DNA topoisomerase IB [Vicinamibacterales bacterium]